MKNPVAVDYRLKWRVMTAVGVGVFLATVDGSIINVSLPTLVRSLNTEFAVVQWVVLGYLLTITTSMLGIGRIADIVGKKAIYILGFEITQVGLLMGIVPVLLGITSPFAGAMSDRAGTRRITVMGLAIMLVGYLAAATLTGHTSAWGYLIRMCILGVGIGSFVSPNNSAIMGSASRSQLGVVSGFMAITRTLGQTVGVAVMGAVWAGRTASYAGARLQSGATLAPPQAQVAALQDTFHTAAALLAAALLLGVWAYVNEYHRKMRI